MKEMIYKDRIGRAELLNNGTYKGYEYVVLSLGSHPTAYIVINEEDKVYGKNYDDIHKEFDLDCHGGLTYSEDYLSFLKFSDKYKCDVKEAIHNSWVIGWDYGHYGDFCGFDIFSDDGKKWTTSEITEECKEVIDQLVEINN